MRGMDGFPCLPGLPRKDRASIIASWADQGRSQRRAPQLCCSSEGSGAKPNVSI